LNKTKFAAVLGGLGILLAGCGGFVYTTVGGTVTGMDTNNDELILRNDTNYTQTLFADGPFSFNVASNGSYVISVKQQPNQVNCTVANASGQMHSDAPVTNVAVTCVPNVQLSANITGLATGAQVSLSNQTTSKGSYAQAFAVTGPVTFSNWVVVGDTYTVSVYTPPPAQFCGVSNNTGTAQAGLTPTPVNVSCAAAVPVKVTVNGLASGQTVVLTDTATGSATGAASGTATDALGVVANGVSTFAWSWPTGVNYNVTVTTQPTGQNCTVTNGSGVTDLVNNPNGASNIVVNCG
jgi:hypothetical protein